ncbi:MULTISPECIES: M61 family metallopeptidase [Microbulbifer]|uniref:M61 family metallopeptidase n=1 Tax=Microbulbifer TaxID=48073 RepID=UPI001E34E714|nr:MULTISPECIES: hypothetical protein [Microbulbifer]UHQ54728.1 hypothetical protein LVE68_14650 [Microbulbifer sp. YPW16]
MKFTVYSRLARLCYGAIFILLIFGQSANAEIIWSWEDQFSNGEKRKLRQWVARTVSGIEQHVTTYPFDIHVSFYRRDQQREPVPWANTRRHGIQGIDFHVDPAFSLEDFLDDWTAPHELSHLLIPYLGREHAWFAEGFASYMQYQVMASMKLISPEEMQQRYQSRIERASQAYQRSGFVSGEPFARAAPRLRKARQYPTMYWGGAVYFLAVDRELQSNGESLQAILREYLACCRTKAHDMEGLVNELDRIAGEAVFSRAMDVMKNRAGFPRFDHLL